MENLKLTRIDSRLIHGQVMTRWVKQYNIKHIIVIDDKTAKSPILKKIILNTVTSNIKAEVLTIEEAAKRWEDNNLSKNNILILFKDVENAVEGWNQGIKYNAIQVGSIAGDATKRSITSNVVMSQKEMEALKSINDEGVDVFVQPIPENKPMYFKEVEKAF